MKAHSEMTARVVDVTPEMAEKWLTQNTHNRRLNENLVLLYAGAMTRGEWRQNGDAIRFGIGGELLDGQHRLAGVVRSGVTIRVLVVEGLSEDTQITMDTGRKRSFGDALKLLGEGDANTVAALCRSVFLWRTGQFRSANRRPTFDQLLEIYQSEHVELRQSVRMAHSVRRQLPGSGYAVTHFMFNKIEPEDCDYFFLCLRDGQDLSEDNPILLLRKAILAELASRRSTPEFLKLALIVKAWNAYRQGESMKLLKWTAGGAHPEKFPEPV